MKKIIKIILISVFCMIMTIPATSYNYDFSSGDDTLSGFDKSTSTDEPVSPDPMSENVQRNKDAAYMPPPYFYGSGDIPTEKSSLYHDNTSSGVSSGGTSYIFTPPPAPNNNLSTSIIEEVTKPLYYPDGSIGTIYVERIDRTIKVYEGEQLDNLKKGAGHFASTSVWNGNVGLCGHNRGSYPYFGFVKDLKIGDRVVYTTQYGSRTYEVFSKEQINEYDYSSLSGSFENELTLITCVQGISELRFSAKLREVR